MYPSVQGEGGGDGGGARGSTRRTGTATTNNQVRKPAGAAGAAAITFSGVQVKLAGGSHAKTTGAGSRSRAEAGAGIGSGGGSEVGVGIVSSLAFAPDPLQQKLEGYLSALKEGVVVARSGVLEMEVDVGGVDSESTTATIMTSKSTTAKATAGTKAGATFLVLHLNNDDSDAATGAADAATSVRELLPPPPPPVTTPSPGPCAVATRLRFPPTLTARGRFLVHEIAEKLGLFHR